MTDPTPTPSAADLERQLAEARRAEAAENAIAAEAAALDTDTPPTYRFRGIELELPTGPGDLPVAAIEQLENGRTISGMRALFGAKFDQVLAAIEREEGRPARLSDIKELDEAIAAVLGVSPGE